MAKKEVKKEEKKQEEQITPTRALAEYLINMRNDSRKIYQEYRSVPKRSKRVKARIEEAYFKGILYACDAAIDFIKKITATDNQEAKHEDQEVQN